MAGVTRATANPLRVLQRSAASVVAVWLDAVFPPRCAGCGKQGAHFCALCAAQVRPVPGPWCGSCGRPVTLAGARCAECTLHPLPLSGLRSAGAFGGPLRRAIHQLKYGGRRSVASTLGALMAGPADDLLRDRPPRDVLVVPVALHPAREAQRGYNQAALLARPVASTLGLPLLPGALRRVKNTAPLVRLNARARWQEMEGAFEGAAMLEGARVLLVDDVATTGSTLAAAARACQEAGAVEVAAVTLAREL